MPPTDELWLELSSWSLQLILCVIHPGRLELPLARTIFHGPKPVRAIEVLLYFSIEMLCAKKKHLNARRASNEYTQNIFFAK